LAFPSMDRTWNRAKGIGGLVKMERMGVAIGSKIGRRKKSRKKFSDPRRSSSLIAFARHYRHLFMEMSVLPRSWLMMGPLPSPRHETFAQAVASGMAVPAASSSTLLEASNSASELPSSAAPQDAWSGGGPFQRLVPVVLGSPRVQRPDGRTTAESPPSEAPAGYTIVY
jgi:hypothetical protein